MARKAQSELRLEYMKQRRRIQQFVRRAEKRGYEFTDNIIPSIPKRVTSKSVEKLKATTPKTLYQKARYVSEKSFGEILTGTEGRSLERSISAQKSAETRKANKQQQPQPTHYEPPVESTYEPATEPTFEPEDIYTYDEAEPLPSIDYTQYNEPDFTMPQESSTLSTFYERMVDERYRKQLMTYNEDASKMLMDWYLAVRDKMGIKTTAKMLELAQQEGLMLTRKESYDQAKVQEYIANMMDLLPEAGDFTKDEIMNALEYEESYEEPL